ncbi:MAG: CbiX/SirB N-terminal domain-containing protein [Betaproteobacteria bacterium]|jgi:sirohydrochlorin cobaltochelatase|nr:CbiX/SirB N-terminal domain-containing protein [Betaproteobacteria bacterium]MBK7654049.1 CbiX/SirB N-terminal domain-containing protein [Betaproteobacteria bacterium]MBP6644636.1 CbiX/SirB N-terminal domain-containing protein [Burkholderiaceae bacterium]
MKIGILVFAHGSKDALWRQPVEAVAASAQALAPTALVRCAYLEWTEPSLMSSVADLVSQGVTSIRILPMFLGIGKHLREDLPLLVADLVNQFPMLEVRVLPSAGENVQLIDMLARIALGIESIDD